MNLKNKMLEIYHSAWFKERGQYYIATLIILYIIVAVITTGIVIYLRK